MSIFWQVLLALIAFFVVLPALGAALMGLIWLFGSKTTAPDAPPTPKPKMKLDARTWMAIVAATIGVFAVLGVVGVALR